MGHQINFFATPADTRSLEDRLRHMAPMLTILDRSYEREPRVVPALDYSNEGRRWLFFYLVRPDDLASVRLEHVAAQGHWSVDVLRSPVIEFDCSYFDTKLLRRGRAYYVDGFYGPDNAWVEKPQPFRTWAKSALANLRRGLLRRGHDYIGRDAQAWLESTDGRLVSA